jgi:RNA polymerase sigma-70 factor, ECF subfamily
MSDTVDRAWHEHRPYLVNLAYQMLNDIGEAEDVAQEAFLRLSRNEAEEIADVRGWLTVVAGRLCLDQIRSARARRESPDDPSALETGTVLSASREPDPADRVTLDDEVHTALLQVLRRLSPAERVAFVLHDVFGVPFDTVAQTVGRPVGTCRQLARRARAKIADATPRVSPVAVGEHREVTEKFIEACAGGDLEALAAVLDPDVWGVGTLLGDPAPPPQINRGRDDVARNLLVYLGGDVTLVSGPADAPVVLAYSAQRLFAIVVLTIRDGLVLTIEATADPSAR